MFRPVYIASVLTLLAGGVAVGIVLALRAGAAEPPKVVAPAGVRPELTKNPAMMLKPDFRSKEVTVHGIAIGDAVDAIPAADIRSQEENTVYMKSGISLAVEDGKVEWIVVPASMFAKWDLKAGSVDEVKAKFGKPDETSERKTNAGKVVAVEHEYRDRGIIVYVLLPDMVGVRLK